LLSFTIAIVNFEEVWDHVHVNRSITFDDGNRKTQ
jgi:hypothetical protein